MNISFGLASLFQGEPLSAAAGIVYVHSSSQKREGGDIDYCQVFSPPELVLSLLCTFKRKCNFFLPFPIDTSLDQGAFD